MGRIVTVNVVDLTRPVAQAGFKKVAIVELLDDNGIEVNFKVITSAKDSDAGSDTPLGKSVSAFFANGGIEVGICAKKPATADGIEAILKGVIDEYDFYGLEVICPKSNQAEYLEKVKTWAEGNKKLAVLELNIGDGAIDTATAENGVIKKIENSDRVVAFAHKEATHQGIASAVAGVCFPQDEGSITWGNKVVTGVSASGYKLADEGKLLNANVNYITKEKGLVITQFGKTTSGSNADITRSKDWLENRCAEALTSTLINNKKVPFTVQGMAMISSSLNQVGVQAVSMGMLDSFYVVTPAVKDIPTNDKANRVLRGVKFIAVLSGAIETIEMELQVRLD